jgi:DNA gyrase/topoisomerase IV subunit B
VFIDLIHSTKLLETVKDGITYQLVCSKGEIVEHLHEAPSTHTKGTLLTFTPDEEVFEGAKFNSDRLTKYLSELSKEYPNIHFSFEDKTTENSVVFE